MPNLDWNKTTWAAEYDWSKAGEEWSRAWGTSDSQWYGSLLPRIHQFLPAAHILELAPGYGRWSRFLKSACDRLTLVDLSEQCIDACRHRFEDEAKIDFIVNDGLTLQSVPLESIDFLFSFDSLVHVEIEVIESYVESIGQKLSKSGVAFIHHSNLKGQANSGYAHNRATTVNAGLVKDICLKNGLYCRSQEEINWGEDFSSGNAALIDCITVLTRTGSKWADRSTHSQNPFFMSEAVKAREISRLYE